MEKVSDGLRATKATRRAAQSDIGTLRAELAVTQAALAVVVGSLWGRRAQPVNETQWRCGETAAFCADALGLAEDDPVLTEVLRRLHAMALGGPGRIGGV